MTDVTSNLVFETVWAYWKTAALVAAVKLDIFTIIGTNVKSADDLASTTGASARGLRILCDFLTVIGLLMKHDNRYSLSPDAKTFLDESSPLAVGSVVDFIAAPEMAALLLNDPVSYVRSGGSNGLASLAPDNPVWVRFAQAMRPLAAPTAKRVAAYLASLPEPPYTVLDIASGHGLYGIEIAKMFPEAIVTAIDGAAVLAVAQENAERAGVDNRFHMIGGSALDLAWGTDFDLILMANFLHHFDRETCTSLLRKAKSSLLDGGRVLAVDFVPNEDRVSPPLPAMFAFWMLATTPGGDAHTQRDLDEVARSAGFRGVTTRPLPPTPETLIIFEN